MIETEAKIKIEKDEMNKILNLIKFPDFFIQKNYIFNLNQGFIRIRLEKGIIILTFKGRLIEGKFKSRQEIETIFKGDLQEILTLFKNLFGNFFFYTKERSELEVNNCHICVDKLPKNLFYLEIEGYSKDIEKTLNQFKMEKKEIDRRSYQEILK